MPSIVLQQSKCSGENSLLSTQLCSGKLNDFPFYMPFLGFLFNPNCPSSQTHPFWSVQVSCIFNLGSNITLHVTSHVLSHSVVIWVHVELWYRSPAHQSWRSGQLSHATHWFPDKITETQRGRVTCLRSSGDTIWTDSWSILLRIPKELPLNF